MDQRNKAKSQHHATGRKNSLRGSKHKRHTHLGREGSQDLDILLQLARVDRVHPAAGAFLVVDQHDGRVLDIEDAGEVVCFVHLDFRR